MIAELAVVNDMSNPGLYKSYWETYVTTLLPEPAMIFEASYYTEDAEGEGAYVFHESKIMAQIVSSP